MAKDDEKGRLYRQLLMSDPWLVIERMRALGFWPADQPMPDEPPEAHAERERLIDELERLRNRGLKVSDPEEALKKERVRRWQESKKRRAVAKAVRETARAERRAAWLAVKAGTVVFTGDGVSGGLAERESDTARLTGQGLPVVHTPEELAAAIGIELKALRWLTFHRGTTTVVHYHRYAVPKKTGGQRHISAPKPALDRAQHWVLANILARALPTEHAHGFVPGRSTVTNAAPHVGRPVVLNVDLADFFPTVGFHRVKGLFRRLGYSGSVATLLALLATEPPRVPAALDGKLYHVAVADRMLPQGACTSPAITNLICRRLDRRLAGIAAGFGMTYTRYADDLTFSGPDAGQLGKLLGAVRTVVRKEGFRENPAKTRIMRRGRAQVVTGATVNDKLGLSRRERRRLRAILHNAAVKGLESQNRDAHPRFLDHLQGRVAYLLMFHPDQAERWRAALARAARSR